MAGRQVIIVGAGLGGLMCGRILSRQGDAVTLLEQGTQAGGALQTFVRDGIRFDTGFHSVGGLGPGEPLDLIFRQLGLRDLPWFQMEPDECMGCDEPFLRLSTGWEEERRHVLDPYRHSIWRIEGGGKTLVDALAQGQQVLLRKKVTAIEDRTVSCADGSSYRGDIVISAIHPAVTMRLVRDHIRSAYLRRIASVSNSPGAFTVYIKLRPGTIRHLRYSIFVNNDFMIHFGDEVVDGFARSLDIVKFLEMSDADCHSRLARASFAEELIRKAAVRLPGLPEAIEKYWTSTPKTWERYTGTPDGSAYGIRKNSTADFLAPQTPLPWLFLTGQNLGLHGILGTSVSAINTCNTISLL
ncbi:MAG: NAD(P)/FAD-dependent oxidoreductase [Bacteroidales bacterium]|nr:NAD(P)/FAD-dependent oxidoreductase [Bacteroidales bacterium]